MAEKQELISEMSVALYDLGTLGTLFRLKCGGEDFGKEHERKCQTRELWTSLQREER